MTGNEIRQKYLQYFAARGHAIMPSSSLVPENDPTTLFTGSGMQPLVPYLLGKEHPSGKRLTDSQKCFRSGDIEEVGDNRHTTFFEMLGNWSLGDYFKQDQLPWFFEFLTKEVGLDPEKLYVTVFLGDEENGIPKDTESIEIWKRLFKEVGIDAADASIGSEAQGYIRGIKEGERIFAYDAKKNWWSRAGIPANMPAGEPGGPDSEVFYDFGTPHDPKWGEHCHPNCDCGRFMEIGNSVFMEYVKNQDGTFGKLPKANVDFGGGLERITAAKNGDPDVFKISMFAPLIKAIEASTKTTYEEHKTTYRVIADHVRAAVFLISDGVLPGNKDQGYFVRRLLRRAILNLRKLQNDEGFLTIGSLAHAIADIYKEQYPALSERVAAIDREMTEEETRFRMTLDNGMKMIEKIAAQGTITGEQAFTLFSTYGFPYELTEELAKERGIVINKEVFNTEKEKHQNLSRQGSEQKFKGGLADHGEKTVQYHTATHLLLAGLRKELGNHVHQAGSNITGERLRFDFTHPEKVGEEALRRVEAYVNDAVRAGATVSMETVPKTDAHEDPTIEGSFWEKYPDMVDVYTVKGSDGTVFSRELCGGPHVPSTFNMGTFKIIKEEASSAGVRRIKAVLE